MNTFTTPVWIIREGAVQVVSRAAPTLVPLVKAMSDDEVVKFADRLAKAFSDVNAEAD